MLTNIHKNYEAVSISISGLSKNYGKQTVLHDISLEIGTGEVVGFLGPNGAGKSTTMKILTGALPYSSGSVKINGLEVSDNHEQCAFMTGYLPEQNPLYTGMYVKEYLNFIADAYKLGKQKSKRVEDVIEMVGLQPEFHKKIGQLSKGYKQRVGLAQALIPNPKVLILDEPTTGLDPNQLEEIRALIKEVGKDKTVLFSTHIMQEITAICNRVVIINKGQLVADYRDISRISQFDEHTLHYEVEFLHPLAEADFPDFVTEMTPMGQNIYSVVAKKDIRSDLFDLAVRTSNKILMLKPVERSMEDVFRSLTK